MNGRSPRTSKEAREPKHATQKKFKIREKKPEADIMFQEHEARKNKRKHQICSISSIPHIYPPVLADSLDKQRARAYTVEASVC